MRPLNREPVHESASRAYRVLVGARPSRTDLAALALAEWALQQPQDYHGLDDVNAEVLLSELQDRMWHDSPEAQHAFLTSASPDDPSGETIAQPFVLHGMEPIDLARYLVDVLHDKLAAMDVGYPVAVSSEWRGLDE